MQFKSAWITIRVISLSRDAEFIKYVVIYVILRVISRIIVSRCRICAFYILPHSTVIKLMFLQRACALPRLERSNNLGYAPNSLKGTVFSAQIIHRPACLCCALLRVHPSPPFFFIPCKCGRTQAFALLLMLPSRCSYELARALRIHALKSSSVITPRGIKRCVN